MALLISVLLFIIALFGVIVIIGTIRSGANSSTDVKEADEIIICLERDFEPVIINPGYRSLSLRNALERAWKDLEPLSLNYVAEINAEDAACQISLDNCGSIPAMLVTFVYPGREKERIPEFICEREEGDCGLYHLRYSWPEEKDLLISQIQTGLGRTLDQVVEYYFWECGFGVINV